MLTPEQIEEITRGTVGLYRAAERSIVIEVTRYLAQGLDAPDWAVQRLGALATLRRTVERVLQLVEAEAGEEIARALARAYQAGAASATTGLPADLLPRDPDAVRAGVVAAEQGIRVAVVEQLATALVADVGQRHLNILRHALDVYRTVVAEATSVSIAGGQTRRQASQFAYQRFLDQGVTSFVDRRGRTWRMSSYVEMALRTVTARAAVEGQVARSRRLGIQFGIVSNVSQECERCRPYEGKVLRLDSGETGRVEVKSYISDEIVVVDVYATLDEARSNGFMHPNCRHSVRSYLPGVTRKPKGETRDPDGDKARQRQRAIERQIRRWKERELGALDPAAKASAAARVRGWQATMRDHLKANPKLKRLAYREQIGAGSAPR